MTKALVVRVSNAVTQRTSFDVLVVGAAPPGSPRPSRPSAPAPASAWRRRARSRPATRPRRRAASRRRSETTTRPSSTPQTSSRARTRAPTCAWSRSSPATPGVRSTGSRSSASSSRGRTAAIGSPRCGGASAKRLLQVGDRTGHAITKSLRDAFESGSGTLFANSPLSAIEPGDNGWRATCGEHELDAATVVLAAGGRCFKIAQERGELSTNHPNATGEVTRMALALGARLATSTSSSTTRTGARGPRRCRATRSPRRREPTARCS